MSVRAKFKVTGIKRTMGSSPKRDEGGAPIKDANGRFDYIPAEMWSVEMTPVYGNGDPNHENTKFWASSPSGRLELMTVNKAAVDQLTLDGEFYVDITPAA
jgi:hypothetical protein